MNDITPKDLRELPFDDLGNGLYGFRIRADEDINGVPTVNPVFSQVALFWHRKTDTFSVIAFDKEEDGFVSVDELRELLRLGDRPLQTEELEGSPDCTAIVGLTDRQAAGLMATTMYRGIHSENNEADQARIDYLIRTAFDEPDPRPQITALTDPAVERH